MKHFYTLLFAFITSFAFAQLTPPTDLQSYYGSQVNATGLALKGELIDLTIDNHVNFLTYSQVWVASRITDVDPDNSDNVLLLYGYNDTDGNVTTDRSRGKFDNGGDVGDWNREHVYPRSLANPSLVTNPPGPGTDALMLRPSDVQRNGARGNQKFADKSSGQYPNGESGDANGGWYPGDEWKGDCARIIMYMYLHYGTQCLPSNVGIGSNASTPDDMIDLFLEWNAEDPVSDIEITRNDWHGDASNGSLAQGNRNPFIDNPYLATVIWGGPNAQDRWENLSVTDFEQVTLKMYPNPANGNEVTIISNQELAAEVYDILGKRVKVQNITANQKKLNVSGLAKGIYIVRLSSENGIITKKLIKQ
ncbi:MAG: endonuclease I [Psychroserpens sp.]|jgi:endonuclease I|uniref:endonuclease n=1 Tax=Psychroserpens sp. TaxID=2020870 RepID=UPI0039E4A06E